MVRAVLAGLPPDQYAAVISGGVEPGDMARALVARMAAERSASAADPVWAAEGYASSAKMNKLTGRLTAGPSLTAPGALGAAPSIYSGGALDHHVDVNRLEEALWEMKRRKEANAGAKLSAAELRRVKQRKQEVKKKMFRQNNRWLFED